MKVCCPYSLCPSAVIQSSLLTYIHATWHHISVTPLFSSLFFYFPLFLFNPFTPEVDTYARSNNCYCAKADQYVCMYCDGRPSLSLRSALYLLLDIRVIYAISMESIDLLN